MLTGKVHGYHGRTVGDAPVDRRGVVICLRVRRLVCPVLGCRRQTFREQVPGLLERLQRRTALRLPRRIPIPTVPVPRVIGVDDFALRRRHRDATIIIDAESGRRVDALPDREAAT
jgi:transposase